MSPAVTCFKARYPFFRGDLFGVPIRTSLENILIRRRWQVEIDLFIEATTFDAAFLRGECWLRRRVRRRVRQSLMDFVGVLLMVLETIFMSLKKCVCVKRGGRGENFEDLK